MKPIERVQKLLAGEKTDRAAINLWKHFPPYDENPKDLVEKTIQFQQRFNWDFVKVTYQGLYSVQDWGSTIKWPARDSEWPNTCSTVGVVTDFGIKKPEDWAKLKVLPLDEGAMADSVLVAKQISETFKGEAPVVVTVFNPLTTAIKMSGDKFFIHLRQNPELVKKGLEIITQTTINFVKELAKNQADGIFFASQLGTYDKLSVAEFQEFGVPYDMEILNSIKDKTWFNIMHMHGNAPMFDIMEKYPVQAVNWHDRLVTLNLKEGKSKTNKLVIGGVDEFGTLLNGTEAEILAQFKDAFEQAGSNKLILGPGCCVPLNVSEDRLALGKKLADSITF